MVQEYDNTLRPRAAVNTANAVALQNSAEKSGFPAPYQAPFVERCKKSVTLIQSGNEPSLKMRRYDRQRFYREF